MVDGFVVDEAEVKTASLTTIVIHAIRSLQLVRGCVFIIRIHLSHTKRTTLSFFFPRGYTNTIVVYVEYRKS